MNIDVSIVLHSFKLPYHCYFYPLLLMGRFSLGQTLNVAGQVHWTERILAIRTINRSSSINTFKSTCSDCVISLFLNILLPQISIIASQPLQTLLVPSWWETFEDSPEDLDRHLIWTQLFFFWKEKKAAWQWKVHLFKFFDLVCLKYFLYLYQISNRSTVYSMS
jgi:hypothetical protein